MNHSFSRFAPASTLVISAVLSLGCETAAGRTCAAEYASSQQKVLQVDGKSMDSVRASLDSVKAALAACRAANRHDEVDHLIKARNELGAQLELLEKRAKRSPRREPTGAELEKLLEHGDPACPKGQGYRVGKASDIKCTGPQLVEMTRDAVKRYYEERGYRVKDAAPNSVKIERGAEQYTYEYPSAEPSARPSCVVLVPPSTMPWAEALARATGKHPHKLEPQGSVQAAQGALPYTVDQKNVVVRIGRCARTGDAG